MTTFARIIAFAKSNTGALIIGASIVIGLNFERFAEYVNDAFYKLSGEAEADRKRAQQRDEEQRARFVRERAESEAWQEFLIEARAKFPQMQVVKNSYGGDFVCLKIGWMGGERDYALQDRIADEFLSWLNGRNDWRYDELTEFTQPYSGCLGGKEVWRANRYQRRID